MVAIMDGGLPTMTKRKDIMTAYERAELVAMAINAYTIALEHDLKVRTKGSYRALGVSARKLERTLIIGTGSATNERIRYYDIKGR